MKRIPLSTYRFQLHQGFGFQEVMNLLDYLETLGITDVYLSPILQARPGSTHGYDICDHQSLNPELGTEADFDALQASLTRRGMGLLMDFVPNHMAADSQRNPWWRDVLENGQFSPYSQYFDVDWNPLKTELKAKVLLPVLGNHYGDVLDKGELKLAFEDGALVLKYFDQTFPINPQSSAAIYELNLKSLQKELGDTDPQFNELLGILTALKNLPSYNKSVPQTSAERHEQKESAKNHLKQLAGQSEKILVYLKKSAEEWNGDASQPERMARLHELLEAQAYRLAYWKTADHEINYRRFFDVSGLAALRMEEAEVFEAVHPKLLSLVAAGKITGLRLDHLDGLYDPQEYLTRLQQALQTASGSSEKESGFYILIEKILARDEKLPAWPIAGTTGYDFLSYVNALFRDSEKESRLYQMAASFTGESVSFRDVAYQSKKLIMETSLAGELNVLASHLNRLSEENPRTRDFTLTGLRAGLMEVIACLSVYRTYCGHAGYMDQDRRFLLEAIEEAQWRNPASEPGLYQFLQAVLLPDAQTLPPAVYEARLDFAMKFQQYTGPVEAKGVEDTAFYRYLPLLSLNEVGGNPAVFHCDTAEFHRRNQERQKQWPHTLNATATHDTKRGEDARCRLNILSEMPEEWASLTLKLSGDNIDYRGQVNGKRAPDAGDEYLFYQALLSAWPCGFDKTDYSLLEKRLSDYMLKAIRESKKNTSWVNPHEAYEKIVIGFVSQFFRAHEKSRWAKEFLPFLRQVSLQGCLQSLSQLTLKITSPGIPDFYEGNELWDFSLVDPDNRRPVDFESRKNILKEVAETLKMKDIPGRLEKIKEWLSRWEDGTLKMLVTTAGLQLRRQVPELFNEGAYIPLEVSGPLAGHLVAFARKRGDQMVIVAVPRLTAKLANSGIPPLFQNWQETLVALPSDGGNGGFSNLITGETLASRDSSSNHLRAQDLFEHFPVAILAGSKTIQRNQ